VPEALGLLAPSPPADVESERCVVSVRPDEPERVVLEVLLDPVREEDVLLAPDSRRPVMATC
jgi:hypothetical protein